MTARLNLAVQSNLGNLADPNQSQDAVTLNYLNSKVVTATTLSNTNATMTITTYTAGTTTATVTITGTLPALNTTTIYIYDNTNSFIVAILLTATALTGSSTITFDRAIDLNFVSTSTVFNFWSVPATASFPALTNLLLDNSLKLTTTTINSKTYQALTLNSNQLFDNVDVDSININGVKITTSNTPFNVAVPYNIFLPPSVPLAKSYLIINGDGTTQYDTSTYVNSIPINYTNGLNIDNLSGDVNIGGVDIKISFSTFTSFTAGSTLFSTRNFTVVGTAFAVDRGYIAGVDFYSAVTDSAAFATITNFGLSGQSGNWRTFAKSSVVGANQIIFGLINDSDSTKMIISIASAIGTVVARTGIITIPYSNAFSGGIGAFFDGAGTYTIFTILNDGGNTTGKLYVNSSTYSGSVLSFTLGTPTTTQPAWVIVPTSQNGFIYQSRVNSIYTVNSYSTTTSTSTLINSNIDTLFNTLYNSKYVVFMKYSGSTTVPSTISFYNVFTGLTVTSQLNTQGVIYGVVRASNSNIYYIMLDYNSVNDVDGYLPLNNTATPQKINALEPVNFSFSPYVPGAGISINKNTIDTNYTISYASQISFLYLTADTAGLSTGQGSLSFSNFTASSNDLNLSSGANNSITGLISTARYRLTVSVGLIRTDTGVNQIKMLFCVSTNQNAAALINVPNGILVSANKQPSSIETTTDVSITTGTTIITGMTTLYVRFYLQTSTPANSTIIKNNATQIIIERLS